MEEVGPAAEIGGPGCGRCSSSCSVTWNSFLQLKGATETGKRQDNVAVQRIFSGSDGQVRGNGDEIRELGF